ncbi:NUDIX hydrolase [Paenibacillus sp. SN-8-1]|uniref:NUDIX hydrolase n=1 Tax=Paenibacillus sp. SN-8-1 TaxID=3435409 RepID=UPI003D9A84F1
MKQNYSIECWITFNNKVLLLEVDKGEDHLSFLQPVTGGIEAGESSTYACCREIFEETGLQVKPDQLELIIKNYEVYIPREELKIIKDVFLLRLDRKLEICLSDEHIGCCWIHFTEVKKRLFWDSNKETYKLIEKYM